jgi:hypothetical protein
MGTKVSPTWSIIVLYLSQELKFARLERHTVMWETSSSSLLARLVNFCGRCTLSTFSLLGRLPNYSFQHKYNQLHGKGLMPLAHRFSPGFLYQNSYEITVGLVWTEWFCSNCHTHVSFFTSAKYAILMDDCSAPSGDHGYCVSSVAKLIRFVAKSFQCCLPYSVTPCIYIYIYIYIYI